MARQAGEEFDIRKFEKYMRDYDRTAFGAGSDKKPPTDRFSGLDVRKMFDKGRDLGGSKSDVARYVIDYAEEVEPYSRQGGGHRRCFGYVLRGYLKDDEIQETRNGIWK